MAARALLLLYRALGLHSSAPFAPCLQSVGGERSDDEEELGDRQRAPRGGG